MALHFLTAEATHVAPGEIVTLSGPEAKHAVVRRVRIGEAVTAGDGEGVLLGGEVVEVSPTGVVIAVRERVQHPAPAQRIVLAQALAKGDRDELAVQAACELGADGIVPWQAARSVSRWDGTKSQKGRERWESIVREAAKQSHRAWVPYVAPAATTAQLAARAERERLLLLDPAATVPLSVLVPDERDVVIVVGPEGGIAPEESDTLVKAGAERVRLGSTILRTSTAGPAAIAVLSAVLGRW